MYETKKLYNIKGRCARCEEKRNQACAETGYCKIFIVIGSPLIYFFYIRFNYIRRRGGRNDFNRESADENGDRWAPIKKCLHSLLCYIYWNCLNIPLRNSDSATFDTLSCQYFLTLKISIKSFVNDKNSNVQFGKFQS